MMQRGFSLIELVIALLISSILAVVLFGILNQTSSSLVSIESIVSSDITIASFYDRLERDVTGAFVPPIGDPDLADKAFTQQLKQAEEQEQKQQEQQQDQKNKNVIAQKKLVKSASLQDIQIKKAFVYEEKNKNLAQFSFITCNPLAVYREAKPCIVRVVYTLRPESGAKTYTLERQESLKLGLKAALKARAYPLLRYIESLRLEFLAPQPVDEKEKPVAVELDQQKEKKKSAAPLITFKQWPIKEEMVDKDDKKIRPDLPQFVKVYLRYANPVDKQIKNYEFLFPIRCFRAPSPSLLNTALIHQQREEQKKQLAQQQTQQDKQAATPASPQKTPQTNVGIAQMMLGRNNHD